MGSDYWVTSNRLERPRFSDFSQDLVILDSGMRTYRQGDFLRIAIMGQLDNRSPHPWNGFKFHVELFNSENELVDVFDDTVYSLVVLPGSQTNFRIDGSASRKAEDYVSHKISIRTANLERYF